MKNYILLLCVLFYTVRSLEAQTGCTDPQATNYSSTANQNDGSCLYLETSYTLDQLAELPDALIENSGLMHSTQGLFTHNDAGNPNEIYKIDPIDGSILETLLVIGENEDWEDMAESDTHLFIGDFGNNQGDRTDLRVYKINKAELGNTVLNAQPINFAFADQVDFSENDNNHDYDCEAFFFHNDSLHLFTKNWVDNKTRHYTIPAEPGFHSASPKQTFDVGGLITSADISEGTVVLLGYTEVGFNFMWLLFDYEGNGFFNGNKRRIELGSGLVNSQTEAIAFKDNESGYISSEQFDLGQVELAPKLLAFNIEQWITMPSSSENFVAQNIAVKAFPNPFEDQLWLKFTEDCPIGEEEMEMRLVDVNGKTLLSESIHQLENELEIRGIDRLFPGVYLVQLFSRDYFWQGKVVKK